MTNIQKDLSIRKSLRLLGILLLFPLFVYGQQPTAASFYEQALTFHDTKNYEEAVAYYTEALNIDHQFNNARYNRAMAYYEMEKYHQALIDLDLVLQNNPEDIAAYEQRGRIKYMLQDARGAVADYSIVMENQSMGLLYVNRGLAYTQATDYEAAMKDFAKAIDTNPDDIEAYVGMGDVQFELGAYEKSIVYYDQALELDPKDDRTLNNRANTYKRMDQMEEALRDYNQSIALNPNTYVFTNRAFYWFDLGDLEQAKRDSEHATQLDYGNANAYYCLGLIYLTQEDYAAGLENLNQAVALSPENATYLNKRGEATMALQAYKEAIADFDLAILLQPDLKEAYSNRAALKYQIRDYAGAVRDQSEVLKMGGNGIEALDLLTFYTNELDKASAPEMFAGITIGKEAAFEEDLDEEETMASIENTISPESYETTVGEFMEKGGSVMFDEEETAYKWKAKKKEHVVINTATAAIDEGDLLSVADFQNILMDHQTQLLDQQIEFAFQQINNKDYSEAELSFNRMLHQNPTNPDLYNGRGLAKYHLKRYGTAIYDFNRAIELNKDHGEAYHNRARALYQTERYEDAIADCQQALVAQPALSGAFHLRSKSLAKLGRFEEAEVYCSDYLKVNPTDIKVLNNRATIRLIAGNILGAIEDYDVAIDLNPQVKMLYINRAEARTRISDLTGVVEDFNMAIGLDPNSAELHFQRGAIKRKMRNILGSIKDLNKAINLQFEENEIYYYERGLAKKEIKDSNGACKDFSKASELGMKAAHQYMLQYCNN